MNSNAINGKEIADKVSGIIRQLGKCGIVANTPTTIYSWDSEAKPYASCLHSGLFMSGIYADLSDLTFNGKLDIPVHAFTDSNNLVVDKKTKPEHIRRLRDTVDILKEDVVKGTYYIGFDDQEIIDMSKPNEYSDESGSYSTKSLV